MPEFIKRKGRGMSQEELLREYRGEKKEEKKHGKKKPAKALTQRTPVPVSPERIKREQQRREEEKARMQMRKKKRRRKNLMIYYIALSIVVVTVFSVLSVTVMFNVSTIDVIGTEYYSNEEVIEASGLEIGDNLIRMNTSAAEQKILQSLVHIDKVTVKRDFPNHLTIELEQAEVMANIYCGGKYYVISYNGKILDVVSTAQDNVTVKGYTPSDNLEVGSFISTSEEESAKTALLTELITTLDYFSLDLKTVIDINDSMDIKITYDDRLEMELGAGTEIHDKLRAASILIADEIGENEKLTILLTNPQRVVTKPIYDTEIEDEGYIATTAPEESPEETTEEDGEENTGDTEEEDNVSESSASE